MTLYQNATVAILGYTWARSVLLYHTHLTTLHQEPVAFLPRADNLLYGQIIYLAFLSTLEQITAVQ